MPALEFRAMMRKLFSPLAQPDGGGQILLVHYHQQPASVVAGKSGAPNKPTPAPAARMAPQGLDAADDQQVVIADRQGRQFHVALPVQRRVVDDVGPDTGRCSLGPPVDRNFAVPRQFQRIAQLAQKSSCQSSPSAANTQGIAPAGPRWTSTGSDLPASLIVPRKIPSSARWTSAAVGAGMRAMPAVSPFFVGDLHPASSAGRSPCAGFSSGWQKSNAYDSSNAGPYCWAPRSPGLFPAPAGSASSAKRIAPQLRKPCGELRC